MSASAPVFSVSRPAQIGAKFRSLDGLRAIAIILVFFHHVKDHIPALNNFLYYVQSYVWQGWIGVDLFFVLSGFLITGLLIDSHEATNYLSGFYVRRILRIFPLYYSVLIGALVVSQILTRLHAPQAPTFAALLPLPADRWTYFFFLTNWLGLWKAQWDGSFHCMLAHFWSLAVEEQFYFVWPFIVWVVRPRAIPWIAGIVAGLSAVIRLAWLLHWGIGIVPPQSVEIQIATICRLDGLFIGALGAYFFRDPEIMRRIRKWLPWIAIAGVGSYFMAFSGILFFPERAGLLLYGPTPSVAHSILDGTMLVLLCGGYTLLALGFGAWVLLAAYTESTKNLMQKFLQSRILAPIGKYSYGIYVFHIPVIMLADALVYPRLRVRTITEGVVTECAYVVVLAAVSFTIAALSYELFEKKILRFKRYFEPKYAPRVSSDAFAEIVPAD